MSIGEPMPRAVREGLEHEILMGLTTHEPVAVHPSVIQRLLKRCDHFEREAARLSGEPCALCRKPVYSVRQAVAETDLPPDTSSADAIRTLWARLQE